MTKSLITQKEFTELTDITKQTLYKAINAGNVKVTKNRQVIFNDPATVMYFNKQIARKAKRNGDGDVLKAELGSLEEQKLREEVGRIKADRKLKELKLEQGRDESIHKETVGAVLFYYIEALNINMLSMPEMVVDMVIDKIKAGCTRGDVIELMRKNIRNEIKSTKKQVKERLK